METSRRKALNVDLHELYSWMPDNAFIQVTEWSNGEGIDATIDNGSSRIFSISYDELDVVNWLVMSMRFSKDED